MSAAAGAAALDALLKGQLAVAIGDIAVADRWFGRSLRLAPGDPSATLGLAVVRLRQGSEEAIGLFQDIVQNHDVREAYAGLATACRLHGQPQRAAEAAAQALGRHAYPANPGPHDYDDIALEAGLPGWCAIDNKRRLVARILPSAAAQDEPRPARSDQSRLTASLHGRTIRIAPSAGGDFSLTRYPTGWPLSGRISIRFDGIELMGSPIDLDAITQVEGFVDTKGGDLHGWAWHPNDPDRDPILSIAGLAGGASVEVVAADHATQIAHTRPLARPRAFRVAPERLRVLSGSVRVSGQANLDLIGSPLDPFAERRSAAAASRLVARLFPSNAPPAQLPDGFTMPAAPASVIGPAPSGGHTRRDVDVVVPVYGACDITLACLASVLDDLPAWARIVVVDDCSPDRRLSERLQEMERDGLIVLLRQPVNGGFPKAANAGMRHDDDRDVVLLNSDTLVPPGWLPTLRDAAYRQADVGSATPFSNDATIMSVPSVDHANPVPTFDDVKAMDVLARRANPDLLVDLPTAIGFCLYIKRDCLRDTGLLREDRFAQGYCEENDFSIRARHLGWRHVGIPGLYVGHVGSQSFRTTKSFLIERNLRFLNELHPGYDAMVQAFRRADPLTAPRRRLDIERWRAKRSRARSVLLVTHGRGGGVQKHVVARAAELRRQGLRPIMLWPVGSHRGEGFDCVVGDGPEGGTPNLRFAMPRELKSLAALLRPDRPLRAEVHHLVGHDNELLGLFSLLGIPYDVVIHDYSWFCTRITLMRASGRYCGEPDLRGCEACYSDDGANIEERIRPTALVERSGRELAAAAQVIVPSEDVSVRMQRHFPGIKVKVVSWEDDTQRIDPDALEREQIPLPRGMAGLTGTPTQRRRTAPALVCVVGAIGIEKGFEYLLSCVRDARERALALRFVVVGFTSDDARLLEAGPVTVTGKYDEAEVVQLIKAQGADVGLLPSLWPETWCYTLTQMWRGRLDVVSFDLGSPAERIRKTGRGRLVPLGLPPERMNTLLLAEVSARRSGSMRAMASPPGQTGRISAAGTLSPALNLAG